MSRHRPVRRPVVVVPRSVLGRSILARAAVLAAIAVAVVPQMAGGPTRGPAPVSAQAPVLDPAAAERVRAAIDAFGEVADRSAAAAWQGADDAYNAAVAALDAARPPVVAALGEPAAAAFGRVDALLPDLEAALSAEDAPRVAALVTLAQAELGALAPGVAAGAPAESVSDSVVAWRDVVPTLVALGASGQWIDMRNGAIDLVDAIESRSPAVAREGGAAVEPALARVRIFADRLLAAALEQSPEASETAAAYLGRALDDVLIGLAVLPAPTATPVRAVRTRFRAYQVRGRVGEALTIPIVAEAVPQIGLGAYTLRVGWSPSALRLVDVAWSEGEGILRRDDVTGRVMLDLPPAPTGPSGDAVVAQLRFEVVAARPEPVEYLPRDEVTAIAAAVERARDTVRLGNRPVAAADLMRAYAGFDGGRDRAGSLYQALDRYGLAAPLAERLLAAVDLAGRSEETDVLILALADVETALDAAVADHFAALAAGADIPVDVESLAAADTLGAPLPLAPSAAGGILLEGGSTDATAAPLADSGLATPSPTTGATGDGSAADAPALTPAAAPATPGAQTGGMPVAVIVALVASLAVGLVAMLWTLRRGDDA